MFFTLSVVLCYLRTGYGRRSLPQVCDRCLSRGKIVNMIRYAGDKAVVASSKKRLVTRVDE